VECKGGSICEHGKRRARCKDCKGGSICIHKTLESRCKECNGSGLCIHQKRKDYCKECKVSACICEHGERKSRCKECGGSEVCPHQKLKINCIECDTSGNICEHQKIKSQCPDCDGSKICIHKKRVHMCVDCDGSYICPHQLQKNSCVTCTPENACQHCKFICILTSKWKPYCFRCYCVLHPDANIPRAFKLKEHYVRDALKDEYKETITMVFDKKVEGGCSQLRPDILMDFGTHCIIVEIDENQHRNYSCEEKRMNILYEDVGFRKLIFIRFNPDGYSIGKKKYKSPFSYTEGGVISIQRAEMTRRMAELILKINELKDKEPHEEMRVEYLFYSG
jgi:hypothetical protein